MTVALPSCSGRLGPYAIQSMLHDTVGFALLPHSVEVDVATLHPLAEYDVRVAVRAIYVWPGPFGDAGSGTYQSSKLRT